MDNRDRWIKHLRRLAKANADLYVLVRALRLEITALKDDNDHYKREFARQNAELLTLKTVREVETLPDLSYKAASDMMFRGVVPPGFDRIKVVDPDESSYKVSLDPYDHSIED